MTYLSVKKTNFYKSVNSTIFNHKTFKIDMSELEGLTNDDLELRIQLINDQTTYTKSEINVVDFEIERMEKKVRDNMEKVRVSKMLPHLVGNICEIFDSNQLNREIETGDNLNVDARNSGKCAIVKTSTRQTYFLPMVISIIYLISKQWRS